MPYRRAFWLALPLLAALSLAGIWVAATGYLVLPVLRRARAEVVVAMLGLTATWLLLRFIRWQFLLRRAGVRVATRPALTGYLASLPGTATPAYIGEAMRAYFLGRRTRIPVRVGLAVLAIERIYDVAAIGLLATVAGVTHVGLPFVALAITAVLLAGGIFRRAGIPADGMARLQNPLSVTAALALSLAAWSVAATLFWVAAVALSLSLGLFDSVAVFAESTLLGALTLVPAGIGVTGSIAIGGLESLGYEVEHAVSIVTLARITSVGAALAVGAGFLWRELRQTRAREPEGIAHFDRIAAGYRGQWAPHVWDLLLDRKLSLMIAALPSPPERAGTGLDVGCGLGLQVAEMRRRGFDVVGIEPSVGLLLRNRSGGAPVVAGDAMHLPVRDASVGFVYTVGVLHHLPGRDAQRQALREIARVLVPGGYLMIHETNPRNPLFRFYMGYLFPILKTIDEGTECWIDPRAWDHTRGFALEAIRYFTFIPDFTPRPLLPAALALERLLERGPTRAWSAHYMVVLRRAPAPSTDGQTPGWATAFSALPERAATVNAPG